MLLGFYSKKKIAEIKKDAFNLGKNEGTIQTKNDCKKELNKKDYEIQSLLDMNKLTIESCDSLLTQKNKYIEEVFNEHKEYIDSINKNHASETKTLRTLLALECDKNIDRYKNAAKKTKKLRIKKKCESKIIDYTLKKLAYEPR